MGNTKFRSSGGSLLKTTFITAIAAIVATVLFVLPAEYGVDPTGVGEKLGLLDLGDIDSPSESANTQVSSTSALVGMYPSVPEDFDMYEPDVLGAPFSITHDQGFRSDTLTISLAVGEEVEYKALMQKDDALVYSWKVDTGSVYTDFHADPGESGGAYPEGYFIRYRESETGESSGTLVAPFAGNHGWYWLNIEETPIVVTLDVRGYYASIREVHRAMQ